MNSIVPVISARVIVNIVRALQHYRRHEELFLLQNERSRSDPVYSLMETLKTILPSLHTSAGPMRPLPASEKPQNHQDNMIFRRVSVFGLCDQAQQNKTCKPPSAASYSQRSYLDSLQRWEPKSGSPFVASCASSQVLGSVTGALHAEVWLCGWMKGLKMSM